MAVPVRDLDADPVERSVLGPALTLLPVYGYARLLADGFHPATPGEFRLKPGVGIPPVHTAKATYGTTCSWEPCIPRPPAGGPSRFAPRRPTSPAPLICPIGTPAIGGLEARNGGLQDLKNVP